MQGLHTVSEANARGHWAKHAKRAKEQRGFVRLLLDARLGRAPVLPLTVTLTRYAPSSGLDDDNLRGALKAARDGVADWLGINDRNPSVTWAYGQDRGPYAVHVTVEARP